MVFRWNLLCGYLLCLSLLGCNSGGGGGPKAGDQVQPDPVNSSPVFTSPSSIVVAENVRYTGYVVQASDADKDPIHYSLDSSNDGNLFSLDESSGELYFNQAADFENPVDSDHDNNYQVKIIASDGKGGKRSLKISVVVVDANDVPVFTSDTLAQVTENYTGIAYVAAATDQDGDAVTYTIEALEDSSRFQIDAISGAVRFNDAPDFENPVDQDQNNSYLLLLTALDAQGGTASQYVSIDVADESQYSATIMYPTSNANLGGYVDHSIVTGRVIDLEDNVVDIADIHQVIVNGMPATIDMGRPGYWSARVPVTQQANTLAVQYRFGNGQQIDMQHVIDNQVLLKYISSISLDSANDRLLLTAPFSESLLSVDLLSGNKSIVSDNLKGSGPQFDGPYSVAYDDVNGNALVLDINTQRLLSVDLVTGDRTDLGVGMYDSTYITLDSTQGLAYVSQTQILSSCNLATGALTTISTNGLGSGPNYSFHSPVTLYNNNSHALYTAGYSLNSVDLSNGNRTVVSGLGDLYPVGDGPGLSNPVAVGLDANGMTAYVADTAYRAIIAVNIFSGHRSYFSSNGVNSGPEFILPNAMIMDYENNRILVGDSGRKSVIAVNTLDGSRSYVANNAVGSGTEFKWPYPVVVDEENNLAYVADAGENVILVVDLDSGNRFVLTTESSSFSPRSMSLDRANNRLLLVSTINRFITGYDLGTGDKTVVSGSTSGTGTSFSQPTAVVVDSSASNLAYVLDRSADAVFSIDLANGNRTLLSGAAAGQASLSSAESIAIDDNANRLLVISRGVNYLISVDMNTGVRQVISGASIGTGTSLSMVNAISFDSRNNRALVSDQTLKAIVSINLDNGDRTIVSDNSTGSGPLFDVPKYVAFDALNNRALVTDEGLKSLLVVEMSSGERAVASH